MLTVDAITEGKVRNLRTFDICERSHFVNNIADFNDRVNTLGVKG
jgi:hypothetical protein